MWFTDFCKFPWKSRKYSIFKVFPCTRSKKTWNGQGITTVWHTGRDKVLIYKNNMSFYCSSEITLKSWIFAKIDDFKGKCSSLRPVSRTVGIHSPFQSSSVSFRVKMLNSIKFNEFHEIPLNSIEFRYFPVKVLLFLPVARDSSNHKRIL